MKWENVHAHVTWSDLRKAMKMFSKKTEWCIFFSLCLCERYIYNLGDFSQEIVDYEVGFGLRKLNGRMINYVA